MDTNEELIMFASQSGRVKMFGSYRELQKHVNELKVRKTEMKIVIDYIEKSLPESTTEEIPVEILIHLKEKYLSYIKLCDELVDPIDSLCALLNH